MTTKKLVLMDMTLAIMVSADAKNPCAEASDKVLEMMQSLTYGADTDSAMLDYSFGSDGMLKGEVDPDDYAEGDAFD